MSLSKKISGLFGAEKPAPDAQRPEKSASKDKPASGEKPAAPGESMRNVNIYGRQLTAEEIASGAHRAFIGGMWDEIGQLQFEFLKSRGLQPQHRLLDVGCGALRGGLHFVRYLDAGNYHGLDINPSLLKAAEHELQNAGLTEKTPHLLASQKFEFDRFGRQFDFMLAVSVFTHLFSQHLVRCLAEARKVLAPDGKFFATFFQSPGPAHLAPIQHPGGITTEYDRDPFHYAAEEIEAIARFAGVRVEIIGDWNHPRSQRMLMFTR